MIRCALFGAGRIGRLHADNLAAGKQVEFVRVYDPDPEAARAVAREHGCEVAQRDADCLAGDVDAAIIASATPTHIDLLTRAVKADKAVLCEKPIDLDIARVDAAQPVVTASAVPVMVGFNRRFDPGHRRLREAVAAGELGTPEQMIVSSRDPGLPPRDYLAASGGLFRDMMIHDFDMVRFVLGEEIKHLSATGSALVDPSLRELDDVDSAMVLMTTESGKLAHINCSRRAVYGYDQRIEVHGSAGMMLSDNPTPTTVRHADAQGTGCAPRLYDFFLDRYAQAFANQLAAFVDAVERSAKPDADFHAGRQALRLADAATEALHGRDPSLVSP
ncbi:inositol 2-dehydrogenase [Rhodovibrio sodomensis]|uniref:Inositol 2-dehydrogenase n=1 Tax=Rhodovibrio sodomensis TaxID=1088 RepID=A0ABS1DJV3_9PROT|nr:inositol 2-dehydrogenase [Rhodovibrio sodomensis]MBK1670770.1 inositol 2-dehydrogenase [Rhodovibrio sodomensis]